VNIDFSETYEPLFHLLECWNTCNSKDFDKHPEKEYWEGLKNVDTVLMYGGRDSGKTYAESVFVPLAASQFNHRILYTRYTMGSTDQSISQALNDRIEMMGLYNKFDYANNTYQCKTNDGRIFITGQKTSSGNQTAKLKSLEGFSMFITDEAEEIKSYTEWNKIKRSIRATDVQCINLLVFNPPTREHWLYKEFFEDMEVEEGFSGIKDNVLYIHSTYLDNIDHISEHNLREYEKLKEDFNKYEDLTSIERESAPVKLKKNWREYKHAVMGGFAHSAEGVIYEDWEEGNIFPNLPYCYGLDFGFNDPDACVKVAVDENNKNIYVEEIFFKSGTGGVKLAEILLDRIGRTDLIIGDAAEKRLISDLYYAGLNIRRSLDKKPGRDIKRIQGYTIIVCGDSPNVKKALTNYAWKDNKSGLPDHFWSDLMDAMRYAYSELVR
jgi:phage terminase large subunit